MPKLWRVFRGKSGDPPKAEQQINQHGCPTNIQKDIEYLKRKIANHGSNSQAAWNRLEKHIVSVNQALTSEKKKREQDEIARQREQRKWRDEEARLLSYIDRMSEDLTMRSWDSETKVWPMKSPKFQNQSSQTYEEMVMTCENKQELIYYITLLEEEVEKRNKRISGMSMLLRRERDRLKENSISLQTQTKEIKTMQDLLDKEIENRVKKINLLTIILQRERRRLMETSKSLQTQTEELKVMKYLLNKEVEINKMNNQLLKQSQAEQRRMQGVTECLEEEIIKRDERINLLEEQLEREQGMEED